MSRWTLADVERKALVRAQVMPLLYPAMPPPADPVAWSDALAEAKAKLLKPTAKAQILNTGPKARPRQIESQSQQAVIKWWAVACHELRIPEELLMAFPLQSNRHIRNAVRMKKEGCRAGTPDLQLCVRRGDCSALWIEMKSPTGQLKPHQKRMLKMLTDYGAAICVCRSADEAIKAITGYLMMG